MNLPLAPATRTITTRRTRARVRPLLSLPHRPRTLHSRWTIRRWARRVRARRSTTRLRAKRVSSNLPLSLISARGDAKAALPSAEELQSISSSFAEPPPSGSARAGVTELQTDGGSDDQVFTRVASVRALVSQHSPLAPRAALVRMAALAPRAALVRMAALATLLLALQTAAWRRHLWRYGRRLWRRHLWRCRRRLWRRCCVRVSRRRVWRCDLWWWRCDRLW